MSDYGVWVEGVYLSLIAARGMLSLDREWGMCLSGGVGLRLILWQRWRGVMVTGTCPYNSCKPSCPIFPRSSLHYFPYPFMPHIFPLFPPCTYTLTILSRGLVIPYPAGGYGAGLLKVFLSSLVGPVACLMGLPRVVWTWWTSAIPDFTTKLWAAGDSGRFFCELLGGPREVVIVLKPPKTICLSVNNWWRCPLFKIVAATSPDKRRFLLLIRQF